MQVTYFFRRKISGEKQAKKKILFGKQILKEKEALTASGPGLPAPGRKGGGDSQWNFNVTWSRETNLRQSVHARSPPRRLAPRRQDRRPQAQLWTKSDARGQNRSAASLSPAGNFCDIRSRRVRASPPPSQRRRRTGYSPLPGGATTPQPDAPSPPAAGECGVGGWADSRNTRKGGGRGRGTSSRTFETALLVLDGPRAAVLSNAISGSF